MSITRTLIASMCLLPMFAVAEIRPGLWEITSTQMSSGEQNMPDMQQLLAQMQNLPPQQRQVMEQMMAKQGMRLGGAGVQLCMSAEQAKAQNIPLQDPSSGCSNEITERSDTLWKFRLTCPQGQGEGETRFDGDKAFTTKVNGTFDGKPSTMESQAHWVADDCAGLQPRQ